MTPDCASIPYRGRFAPSPTGPLHFGSLVAALGSCLDARAHGGEWLLRIEDVDTPRNEPGADSRILRTLEAFGFEWDGLVLWQSSRLEAYAAALAQLKAAGLVYPCSCSRREIAEQARHTAIDGGPVYPGTCRGGCRPGSGQVAWRLRLGEGRLGFEDRLQGRVEQDLAREVGDFVLLRADGLFAYQLAVTVDDAWQDVSDVVRGADLLSSTPRQIALLQALGMPVPRYAHLPVAANAAGEKLSKQTLALPLDTELAAAQLCRALTFLGQAVPSELWAADVFDVWAWALRHWNFSAIPRQPLIIAD